VGLQLGRAGALSLTPSYLSNDSGGAVGRWMGSNLGCAFPGPCPVCLGHPLALRNQACGKINYPGQRDVIPYDSPFALRVYQHIRSVPKSSLVALYKELGWRNPQLVSPNVSRLSEFHHGGELAAADFFPEGPSHQTTSLSTTTVSCCVSAHVDVQWPLRATRLCR
jgi:hypothetical protein